MSVKVAIRVRPFNEREKKLGSELCVKMRNDVQVVLLDDQGKDARKFNFDYAIWSHDSYKMDKQGYYHKDGPMSNFWDQKRVYSKLGVELLQNSVKGYNCCLFAYGQTGSGKSYSIFGYGTNEGIVPMICEEMFNGGALVRDEKHEFSINISMLEIYNEKIQDLLVEVKKRPRYGLKVHENPKIGVFVKGLSRYTVNSYEEIEKVIGMGNKNKTIGATLMNDTSSRSHTVIKIEVHQKELGLIKTIEKNSMINLVDLAGSEKVGKTGARGDRLKEACSINRSLMTLGIVIKQLVKKQCGKKTIISYRDSVLTRMLQNALGGNSKTTMICAISPSRDNYDETMSTLRYANEAKRIQNRAVINESEVDKMIRELQEENKRLKVLLNSLHGRSEKPEEAEIKNILCQIEELDDAIRQKTGIEIEEEKPSARSRKTKKIVEMIKAAMKPEDLEKTPHLTNLNEDMMQSGNIIYNLSKNTKIFVGRGEKMNAGEGVETIILNSASISPEHAMLSYKGGKLEIVVNSELAAENTFVNGVSMIEYEDEVGFSREVLNMDRIIFGTSSTYLVKLPVIEGKCGKPDIEGKEITWEFCQIEKTEVIKAEEDELKRIQEEEIQEREKAQQEELSRMREMIEKLKEEQSIMTETKRETAIVKEDLGMVVMDEEGNMTVQVEGALKKGAKVTQEDLKEQEQIIRKAMEEKEKMFEKINLEERKRQEEETLLNEQISNLKENLIQYYPMILEANFTAEQLNRRIEFIPFIAYMYNPTKIVSNKLIRQILKVKVVNREDGYVYIWDLDTFDNRFSLIQESIQHFYEVNDVLYKTKENDPFWDPEGLIYYSEAVCKAKEIVNRFDLERTIKLTTYEGEVGVVELQVRPTDEMGQDIDEEILDEIDNPYDLVEKKLPCHFVLTVKKLSFLRGSVLNLKFKLQFQAMTGEGIETFSTEPQLIRHLEIPLNWSQLVLIPNVNRDLVRFYMENLLRVHVYIENTEKCDKLGKLPPPKVQGKKKTNFEHVYNMKSEIRPSRPIKKSINVGSKPNQTRRKTKVRKRKKTGNSGWFSNWFGRRKKA